MFLLPDRDAKPRNNGTTMVLDTGLGCGALAELLDTASEFIDYVKFGWATSILVPNLSDKIRICLEHSVTPYLGGTLFEVAYLQNKIDDLKRFLSDHKIPLVEISDGTVEIPFDVKLEIIRNFSKDFYVFSEVGEKDVDFIEAPSIWVDKIKQELSAGSLKVITEGRESGDAGLFRRNNEIRTGLIDEIVQDIAPEFILWEAPVRIQQAWFIKKFGSNVNLGNIKPTDVISLETLRLGLRSDTLLHFHSNSL